MNYENPTRLRIGQHGNLAGKDFRVIGRVVMGATIDGETYYWSEFNLRADDRTAATLVFEETDDGGEWKLFTDFTPEFPMSAAEAATKQVGDSLNLNGENVRVTLVQTSQVYRIEGQPPDENLRIGSAADYFNAEAGGIMQVVSWTGDEVEYYNGVNLTNAAVEQAFNLPRGSAQGRRNLGGYSGFSSGSSWGSENKSDVWNYVLIGGIGVIVFIIFLGNGCRSGWSHREAAPVQKISAAAPPFPIGTTVAWRGTNFQITAHAVVEIDEVGSIYERHEYILLDDNGHYALLVGGKNADAKQWAFYTPLDPLVPPTIAESAAQKIGDVVNVDGIVATVSELFQSTIRSVNSVNVTDWQTGEVAFNYLARSENNLLLVRWNRVSISFYRGKMVSPADFKPVVSGN